MLYKKCDFCHFRNVEWLIRARNNVLMWWCGLYSRSLVCQSSQLSKSLFTRWNGGIHVFQFASFVASLWEQSLQCCKSTSTANSFGYKNSISNFSKCKHFSFIFLPVYHCAFDENNPEVNVLVMENLRDQGYKPLRPETCGLVFMRAAMTRWAATASRLSCK